MGAEKTMKRPRVVLDTNCVVSALLFVRGKASWIRDAWMARRFVPLVSHHTADELIRVLSYSKFHLDHFEQEMLIADYLPFAEVVKVKKKVLDLPTLKDPDDLMFLSLALTGRADAIVSGDAHLLMIKAKFKTIPLLSLAEFSAWLGAYPPS